MPNNSRAHTRLIVCCDRIGLWLRLMMESETQRYVKQDGTFQGHDFYRLLLFVIIRGNFTPLNLKVVAIRQ